MKKNFKMAGGAAAALAAATMAVPAQAQDRRWGGRDRDRHHHHHRGNDKVDAGGLVLGALLVGGLVALASGEKKRIEKAAAYEADYEAALPADDGAAVPIEGSAPVPDMPAPYAAEYDGLYDMEAATDRCASEAETFGQQFARMARVSSISSQVWNGKSWVIKGKLELAERYADPGKATRKFRCALRAGREPAVTIEGLAGA